MGAGLGQVFLPAIPHIPLLQIRTVVGIIAQGRKGIGGWRLEVGENPPALTQYILQTTAHPVSGGDVYSVGAGLLDAFTAVEMLVSPQFFLPMVRR
jgi:hypothetical protein